MTRCKYCRAEELFAGECNYDIPSCRDRMRDRERRIVRVFWRVRDTGSGTTIEHAHRASAVRFCPSWCALYRVTVRRKAKP